MLPAPSTTATSTPRSCRPLIWRAICRTTSGSVPYSRSPIRASPESLRRIRLKTGSAIGPCLGPDGESREAADDDVLAGRAGELGAQLLDRLAVVLVGVDVHLVQEDGLLHPLAQLALGDLAANLLGLVGGLLLEHAQLGLLGVLRDVLLGDVLRRRGGGDVQRDVAGERREVVVARDEVRVAVDLDQHADLVVGVDVGLHGALGRLAAAHLERLVAEAHPQELGGRVDVAAGLLERLLAVHHARARAVAELLDLRCGNAHLASSSFFFLVVFFAFFLASLSSSWTASPTAPAALAAAPATAPSGPGARSATASAALSATLAAVSAAPWAVSTASLAASCARSTRLLSSLSAPASAGAASGGASAVGSGVASAAGSGVTAATGSGAAAGSFALRARWRAFVAGFSAAGAAAVSAAAGASAAGVSAVAGTSAAAGASATAGSAAAV